MSFIKTLATLAVGFAAARGADKVKQMGGIDGLTKAMRGAGDQGGMADQLGAMAQKMGLPVDQAMIRNLMGKMGGGAAEATESTQAGLGALFGALSGAASAGASGMAGIMESLTAGTPAGAMAEEHARLMIRAMIAAAKADGVIDPNERARLLDHLKDASEEEVAFISAELDAPLDIAALVSETSATAAAQVYSAALMSIAVDTDAERHFLKQLAQGLQLSPDKIAAIHASMGKPTV